MITTRPKPQAGRPRPYRFVQRLLDRYGVWRCYLRPPGRERVTLHGAYGSPEFAESYRLAMAGCALPREIGADRTVTGSINHLITIYKRSAHWLGLAVNSQRTRSPIMEKLRSGAWGNVMVHDLGAKHVRAILTDAGTAHAKKHWLKTLRGLFAYAIEIGQREDDPSVGIKVKTATSDGYHTWTDQEIAQYRAHWPLGSVERLAMELALETASRRVELCQLGRQHVRAGRITIKRVKGCNAGGIPLSPALAAALDAMPPSDHLTFLVAAGGQPFSPDQLGVEFAKWATAADLPQRCRLHGLRKARSAQLATAGATAHQVMAVTGHKSLAEVQRYTAKFNRRQAADTAMALLKTGTGL